MPNWLADLVTVVVVLAGACVWHVVREATRRVR